MQQYIIKSFKRVSDQAIFERVETGTNSGGYVFNTEVKRIKDFLCDGSFVINSVIKQVNPNRPQYNIVFTVGDRVVGTQVQPITITHIVIRQSEVLLLEQMNSVRLVNATKYVVPTRVAPITHPRPTTVTGQGTNVNQTVTTNTSFDEIEQTIIERNPRPIRLEKTLKRRRETLQEFLIKFFKEWNNEKKTIYVDDDSIQTNTGKRRSLGDIYMICKYYYPNCTLTEVLNLLYNVIPTIITRGFRTSYCSTIHKRVWYYSTTRDNIQTDKTNNDEFGKPFKFYVDNLNGTTETQEVNNESLELPF